MDIKFRNIDSINKAASSFGLTLRDSDLFGRKVEKGTQLVYKGFVLCGQLVSKSDSHRLDVSSNVNLLYGFGLEVESLTKKPVTLNIED